MATEKRLIDANAIKYRVRTYGGWGQPEEYVTKLYINKMPTVDAVEVVHGRWIIEKRHTVSQNPYMDDNYHSHATCSNCGFVVDYKNASFGYAKLHTPKYCEECGVKMDGDGNG